MIEPRPRWLLLALLTLSVPGLAQVTTPYAGLKLVRSNGAALVVADLCAAGVSVRATKYGERQATPQAWAQRADVNAQVAINGDFFDFPGWSWVIGRARGAGEDWPADKQLREVRQYFQFGPGLAQAVENAATLPSGAATDIVGSHNLIMGNGQSLGPGFDGDTTITTAHRRTAVGLSADRRFLFLYSSDNSLNGSQLVADLVALAAAAGGPPVDVAANMDGGGSSQLYVQGLGQIVTSGRQVNNHLGVFARGSGPATNCPLPPAQRDVVLRANRTSGWTLDARGTIAPFGGAPALGPAGPRWTFDIARSLALRPDGVSGYVLDGYGALHAVGAAPPLNSGTYWPNWDIARSFALRADGVSGYVLDGYGGVHAFGGAPAATGYAYWPNWDIARDLVLRADGASGYVLDGYGGVHPFGGAPAVKGGKYFGVDVARALTLSFDGTSGYVVDQGGAVWAFGDAPPVAAQAFGDTAVTSLALANDGVSGVVLHATRGVRAFHSAQLSRALQLLPGSTAGYRLRGDGALEPVGGARALTAPVLWPNWDIARDFVLRADGTSGWILDGYGGLHPFGGAPAPTGGPYWPNFDIARALARLPSGLVGYVLDGYGPLHPLTGAPALTSTGSWPGQDLARDVALTSDGRGGYVLNGKGSVHPVGTSAPTTGAPSFTADLARGLVLRDDTSGYVLDGWGGVHAFGGASAARLSAGGTHPGWDVFRDVALVGDGGVTMDVYGHLHLFSTTPRAVDGGQSEIDGGPAAGDAGTGEPGPSDAGEVDAGADDGGAVEADAGEPGLLEPAAPDGGVEPVPGSGDEPTGCGCQADAGLLPLATVLALWVSRRRRGACRAARG